MTSGDTPTKKLEKVRQCPICGKPAVDAFAPFCSTRCSDVDLHRWLKGTYAIPAGSDEPDDEDEP